MLLTLCGIQDFLAKFLSKSIWNLPWLVIHIVVQRQATAMALALSVVVKANKPLLHILQEKAYTYSLLDDELPRKSASSSLPK